MRSTDHAAKAISEINKMLLDTCVIPMSQPIFIYAFRDNCHDFCSNSANDDCLLVRIVRFSLEIVFLSLIQQLLNQRHLMYWPVASKCIRRVV